MKKIYISFYILLSLPISFSFVPSVSASTESVSEPTSHGPSYLVEQANNFSDQFDNDIQPYSSATVRNTIISSSRYNYKWIGYLSESAEWTRASSYILSSGRSYLVSGSMTYEGMGVSLSTTYSSGVSRTLPADPSRYSRLGMYADITVRKYKSDKSVDNYTGQVFSTWYSSAVTHHNQYVTVVY